MSARRRRFTLHAAAILAVLHSEQDRRVWAITEVAEECGLVYGSAYSVLQRLWGEGLVARQFIDGGFGHAKLHYDLTGHGQTAAAKLLKYMPNPVEALSGWVIEEPEETPPAPKKKKATTAARGAAGADRSPRRTTGRR